MRRAISLLLLLWAVSSQAAVTYDATSVQAFSAVISASVNHTIGAGCASAAIIGCASWRVNATAASNFTFNAETMTPLGTQMNGSDPVGVTQWGKATSSKGSAMPLTVSFATAPDYMVVGGISACGVHQTTPFGTTAQAQATTTTPSVTVSSATGELVADCVGFAPNDTALVGSGQQERWNAQPDGMRSMGSTEAGAASVVMDWSTGSFVFAASVGTAFKIAPAVVPRRRTGALFYSWLPPWQAQAHAGGKPPPQAHEALPTATRAAGTYPASPVAIGQDYVAFGLEIDRADLMNPQIQVTVTSEISYDGGVTWAFLSAFTAPGGLGSHLPTSFVRSSLADETNPDRIIRSSMTITGPPARTNLVVRSQ